jgi:hypothetical protein
MGKDLSKPLREVPINLCRAFKPLFSIEALVGIGGYVFTGIGIYEGNAKKIIGGLVAAGLGGLYGAYRDGCFSGNIKTSN